MTEEVGRQNGNSAEDHNARRSDDQWQLIGALAESAPVAIYHADSAGHLTYANQAYRDIFDLSADQSLDDWAPALHPADRAWSQDSWAAFLQRREPSTRFEYRTRLRDGGYRYLAEHVVAMNNDGVPGYVGTITDVTALKEAQGQLDLLNRQLIDASRQAGRADIATSVLHNVGNVLTSVNVSADLVIEQVSQSKALDLRRVADLLKSEEVNLTEFLTNDERGKRLPGYLGKLASQVEVERARILFELESLKKNIDHIKEIVAMQQTHAMLGGVAETVDVSGLVEDSLSLNAGAYGRHGITVKREFPGALPIVVDKHRVLQILVNLLRNAKHACLESERADKTVTVRVAQCAAGVQVVVADNGVGISEDNLPRLFRHGFTTKKKGHGFGLHSGSLAARELGGTLTAESQGLGTGATFTLELPLAPPPKIHHE